MNKKTMEVFIWETITGVLNVEKHAALIAAMTVNVIANAVVTMMGTEIS